MLGVGFSTLVDNPYDDWLNFTVDVDIVEGEYYWLAFQISQNGIKLAYDSSGGVQVERALAYGGFPDPFGDHSADGTFKWSIFATYTVGGGGGQDLRFDLSASTVVSGSEYGLRSLFRVGSEGSLVGEGDVFQRTMFKAGSVGSIFTGWSGSLLDKSVVVVGVVEGFDVGAVVYAVSSVVVEVVDLFVGDVATNNVLLVGLFGVVGALVVALVVVRRRR